ncbi:MAG: HlyD family efflux transporter periplasmic adaptor subunit [Bryobacterales bacterium]|nr:HlyD family efflux transporter periplasmic adaptor subunit [Bryobacterales bacterium]
MKKTIWILTVLLAAAAVALAVASRQQPTATAPAAAAAGPRQTPFIAAAGRVEPASEEVKIGAEMDGKLARVAVEEGDAVRRGQVVATLQNGEFIARVDLAKATLREREAQLERLRNGARVEEKREAEALLREAEAQHTIARSERDRRQNLLDRGAISRSEFDFAARDVETSRARLDAVRERLSVVRTQTRPEDLKRAEADIANAEALLAEAQAMVEKTIIRAPLDGRVLRRYRKAGESVSGKGDTPVVSLGDLRTLRVRVDVDETDVARLHIGQPAWVTADAYGDKRFTGKVVRIGQALGRKNIRTDEPTERVDTKILETLVELDPGQTLPIGLRVDAFLEVQR